MNQPEKNKNVGSLYQLKLSVEINEDDPPRFCFIVDNKIHNKTFWKDRFPVTHKTLPLMLVKSDMDMTPETIAADLGQALHIAGSAGAAMAVADAEMTLEDDYDLARDQWEKSNCVLGSVFMAPVGRLIWISDIDFKYFEEVKL